MIAADAERSERLRGLMVTHAGRMLGAMLCWTALQSATAHYQDGRAQAQGDGRSHAASARH